MKKRFNLILSLLVVFTVLLVTGCNKTTSNTTTKKPTTTKAPTTTTTKTPTTTTVEVIDPLDLIVFDSKTFKEDGTAHSLEATNIPEGYSANYLNNSASEYGKTYVTCEIKDTDNNTVRTLYAIIRIDLQDDPNFNKYCDDYFLSYLGDDAYGWSVYSVDPTNFGYERDPEYVAEWYSYKNLNTPTCYKCDDYRDDPSMVTADNKCAVCGDDIIPLIEAYSKFQVEAKEELLGFNYDSLSDHQKLIYDDLLLEMNYYIDFYTSEVYGPMMELEYIDQEGGYVANLVDSIENYIFRREIDVVDAIDYLKSTQEAFATYLTYCEDKFKLGYGLNDYTLNQMIDYLNDVVDEGDNFYLYELVGKKIDEADFLSDSEKAEYKTKFNNALRDVFMVSCQTLSHGLENYLGKVDSEHEGYLSAYGEAGKELYKLNLANSLGYSVDDFDFSKYEININKTISAYGKVMDEAIALYRSGNATQQKTFINYVNGKSMVGITDVHKVIDWLKDWSVNIIKAPEHDITVNTKYMDDTVAEKSNTVAYYIRSALDAVTDESVTINGKQLKGDYNDLLLTMGHEGYPGHLYAFTYKKSIEVHPLYKLMSQTAFNEGWATYVELALLDYLKANIKVSNIKFFKAAVDYLFANQMIGFLLYTKVDYMIHMNNWKIADIKSYMDSLGFNGNAAEEIYRLLIETPTGYTPYGYGEYLMYTNHQNVKTALGDAYSEVEYNMFLLTYGQNNIALLDSLANEFIEDQRWCKLGELPVQA